MTDHLTIEITIDDYQRLLGAQVATADAFQRYIGQLHQRVAELEAEIDNGAPDRGNGTFSSGEIVTSAKGPKP